MIRTLKFSFRIVIFALFIFGTQSCANKLNIYENLVVFKLTIPAYATVTVRSIESNERKSVKLKHLRGTYFVSNLPAGTYEIINYRPFKDVEITTKKSGIRFVVSNKCTNYLGKLNLLGEYFHSNGKPTKTFWEFNERQFNNLSPWLVNKMRGSDVCFPYKGGIGKYEWNDFQSHMLTAS